MSKKITHKEHRQLLSELYKKQGGKWIYQADAYIKQQEKQEKLLELYKQAYDKANEEILKMFTHEQDEKTTMSNIIYHLDNVDSVQKIKELEK